MNFIYVTQLFIFLLIGRSMCIPRDYFQQQSTETKIIDSSIDSYRGFVSVYNKNTKHHLCEGVLLDVDFAIVTAKCVDDYQPEQLEVFNHASTIKQNINTVNAEVRDVTQKFTNPDFDNTTWKNDVAILKIVSFDSSTTRDILTALEHPVGDTICQSITSDPQNPNTLVKCDVRIVDTDICNSTIYQGNLPHNVLCGTIEGDEHLCQNSTGSALICKNCLAGLLSYGTDCCDPKSNLGIYVDISKYNNWIDEVFRSVILMDGNANKKVEDVTTRLNELGPFYFEDPTKNQNYKPVTRPEQTSIPSYVNPVDHSYATQSLEPLCKIVDEDCPNHDKFGVPVKCATGVLSLQCFHNIFNQMPINNFEDIFQTLQRDSDATRPKVFNIHYHIYNIVHHHYHFNNKSSTQIDAY